MRRRKNPPMKHHLILLSLSLLAAGCGGGGSSPTPLTVAPTAAPTTAPLSRTIAGAPATATAAQLSTTRRSAQAQGITNGLPILVESSGMIAAWAGTIAVWVTDTQTNADIAETSGTIVPSGNLAINNAAFAPLSCLGQISGVCTVHPTGWTFGTSSTNGKPVGKQTLTVTFGDGTTGSTFDYIYDGWNLPCNSGWAYVGGIPVAQATQGTSDVFADCAHTNIIFPKGAVLASAPTADKYGNTATVMPTLTAAIALTSPIVTLPMTSTAAGQVYAIATQDGGFAKVYFSGQAGGGAINATNGMSLHASPDATYPF